MKLALSLLVALFAGTISVACADEQASNKSDGWIELFDGKTLKGWKANENPQQWKVTDGKIVAAGPRSHLFYVGGDADKPADFKDFHFKADVMTTPGSNSGIFFHTQFQNDGWPTVGYEAQVNNTHTDPVKSGSIYNVVKVFTAPAKDDTWFTEEVIVKGKNVTVKVDGKTLFEFDEPDGVQGTRKLSHGTFALQAHDPKSIVYYKNIMVKPLAEMKKR